LAHETGYYGIGPVKKLSLQAMLGKAPSGFQMDIRTPLVVLTSLSTLPATDIYLPSLPGMADHFGISEAATRATLSVYLVASLLSAPVLGALSDRFGRRPVLLSCLAVFICGSAACSISDGFSLFLIGRFLQGAGSVVTPVVGWAIIHDIHPGEKGATVMSWLGAIFSASPLVAPAVGGFVDVNFGWRWSFIIMSALATVALLVAAFFLEETHKPTVIHRISPRHVVASYLTIFRNSTFLSYVGIFAILMIGEWSYLTVAPFYFDNVLHFSPDNTGFYISMVGVIYFSGTLVTPAIVKRRGAQKSIRVGLFVSLAGALLLLAVSLVSPKMPPAISLTLGIYLVGTAIIWGPTTTMAIQCFEHERASASAARALLLNATFVVGSFCGNLLGGASLFPLALALICCTAGSMYLAHKTKAAILISNQGDSKS
jgi:Bcr/CflA subfamily drug resistance transporter